MNLSALAEYGQPLPVAPQVMSRFHLIHNQGQEPVADMFLFRLMTLWLCAKIEDILFCDSSRIPQLYSLVLILRNDEAER